MGRCPRAVHHDGGEHGAERGIEPISLSYELACGPVHAFEVWTEGFSAWWPKSHLISGDPNAGVCLEPRLGGRIFERTSVGTEIDWGEITDTLTELRPEEVWVTHGREEAVVRWCELNQMRARPLHLVGYEDEAE